MSDGIKSMYEDADEYSDLCEKFKEKPRWGTSGYPYGWDYRHEQNLRDRAKGLDIDKRDAERFRALQPYLKVDRVGKYSWLNIERVAMRGNANASEEIVDWMVKQVNVQKTIDAPDEPIDGQ